MANSNDMFLSRSGVERPKEIWAIRSGKDVIPIAGADGALERKRQDNEAARVAGEKARSDAETARASAETERIKAELERSTKDAERGQVAIEARSAAREARSEADSARTQASAARTAAQRAESVARLAKPIHIQEGEPPMADRLHGSMWVQTSGTTVKSINKWDTGLPGDGLFPGADTCPGAETFPGQAGEWRKYTV